jgi:hypothetical protein
MEPTGVPGACSHMATQPDPSPDTIEPQSPDELTPYEDPAPAYSPDEEPMIAPDFDQPDISPQETPEPL